MNDIRRLIRIVESGPISQPSLYNKFWINIETREIVDANPEHNRFVINNQEKFGVDLSELPDDVRAKMLGLKRGSWPANWPSYIDTQMNGRGWIRCFYGSKRREIAIDAKELRQAQRALKLMLDLFPDPKKMSLDLPSNSYMLDADQIEAFARFGRVPAP